MTASPASQNLEERILAILNRAVAAYLLSHGQDPSDAPAADLQVPRNPEHGDWATSIAMKLAKTLKIKPIEIAEGIRGSIEANNLIEPPEAVAPGFLNIRVAPAAWRGIIEKVLREKDDYGRSATFANQRMLVEFVSANPTGPLHIGHGRNAVVGDTLARIYAAAGFTVEREYYYNDAGVQMRLLGRSLRARYLQKCGREEPLPEGGYQGEYLGEIAAKLFTELGDSRAGDEDSAFFTKYAADSIMESIQLDLKTLGISFDHYFSETSMHQQGKVEAVIDRLRAAGGAYENDGALWLRTTAYGDDKDRVLRKSDGTTTYVVPDIAYHEDKFARGYDRMVNVLGADHHSYVVRLKAALKTLGHDPDHLHVVLLQMVGVTAGGETKKLSTRAGDFTPLGDILTELSPEVVRFFFLLRAADSQLIFDLDLARQQSMDNPYYYVQYAHARCCSLLRKAESDGMAWQGGSDAKLELLTAPEERGILLQMSRLPGAIAEAARKDEPLGLTMYLRELATAFHAYFSAGSKDANLRCIQAERPDLTEARLTLIVALRQTLASGLHLMGVTPLDRL